MKKWGWEGENAQPWGISGSWDHGGKLAASNRKWRPLTFAGEWQFWGKKVQTYPDRHTHTPSTTLPRFYEFVLFHIIRLCTSHYCPVLLELLSMSDASAQWGQHGHSTGSRNTLSLVLWITNLLPFMNVFVCLLYSSSAQDLIQDPIYYLNILSSRVFYSIYELDLKCTITDRM